MKRIIASLGLLVSFPLVAFAGTTRLDFQTWLTQQADISSKKIIANINPTDGIAGAVLASPQKVDPDYYYHWVRDASLTMAVVLDQEVGGRATSRKILFDYVAATQRHQAESGPDHLGEPKYMVSGEPFTGPWGRPQNDGPALRATVLTKFAQILLSEGNESYVRRVLYDGALPSKSVIKMDLEYVSHHWSEPSFDLWEENQGDHFYTLMTQQRALFDGADLADRLGDSGAAKFYREQAHLVRAKLNNFLSVSKGHILTTLNRIAGLDYKDSQLDTAVLLAVLHTSPEKTWLSPSNEWVVATLNELSRTFSSIYAVNSSTGMGVAFGRYPEDVFYGGNPWFLATAASAEIYFKMATELASSGKLTITSRNREFFTRISNFQKGLPKGGIITKKHPAFIAILQGLRDAGDAALRRMQFHVPASLQLSEQFDRTSGFCKSANDLTWSYASFLTALKARNQALETVSKVVVAPRVPGSIH